MPQRVGVKFDAIAERGHTFNPRAVCPSSVPPARAAQQVPA